MRKFISILSATAIAASSFVAFGTMAFADDEVLFSDNFDKYENNAVHMKQEDGTVLDGSIGDVFLDGTFIASNTSKEITGLTLATTGRGDDSSYYQIVDKNEDGDKYIQTQTSRFSRQGAGAHIDIDGRYAAEEGKDVVLAFDIKEDNASGTTFDDVFTIGAAKVDMKTLGINDGDWWTIKAVVTTSGTSVYVVGIEDPVSTSTETSLSSIKFDAYVDGEITNDAQKSSTHPLGYPTWGIDNMVVYTSADGAASEIPAAEQNDATPAPTAAPTAAPITVEASAKAATIVTDGELRISEKTAGAVFRFDVSSISDIESAQLVIKAAPRSYKDSDGRWENTEIWTYRVNSDWNGTTNEITADAWNKLSKGDPFNKQWTAKDTATPSDGVPPYQTLEAIDVTDKISENGIAIFAFRTSTAREHAIDAYLEVVGTAPEVVEPTEGPVVDPTEAPTPEPETTAVEAAAKAATKVENDELRISDGTNGAVFRFDVSNYTDIQLAKLVIEAAPRSYKAENTRFENAEIWTYKVNSDWNGTTNEITTDAWNKLSKGDNTIDKQYTEKYPSADENAVPPYQTLKAIDVTSMINENGVVVFAFKTGSAREHAIKAHLEVAGTLSGEPVVEPTTAPTAAPATGEKVEAVAKAATKVENDELRISDGTNGAVFRFDVSDYEDIESVKLIVKAAPRSYSDKDNRWANTEVLTYKVNSDWNGATNEITTDAWNKLSKGDPIDRQYTANYTVADATVTPPYQTLNAVDVTSMINENGVIVFAFKTATAREHAIDAYLEVTTKADVWTLYTATKDENGVLTGITSEPVSDPATVEVGAGQYLWNQKMEAYKAEAAVN